MQHGGAGVPHIGAFLKCVTVSYFMNDGVELMRVHCRMCGIAPLEYSAEVMY